MSVLFDSSDIIACVTESYSSHGSQFLLLFTANTFSLATHLCMLSLYYMVTPFFFFFHTEHFLTAICQRKVMYKMHIYYIY